VIQLDNINKGEQMLTPEQIAAHDEQIKQLPTIKKLEESDKEIIEDLEGLRQGQNKLEQKVDDGFAKGKDKMEWLETMFKNHIEKTEHNHKEAMGAISSLDREIKDNKMRELEKNLQAALIGRQKDDDKRSAFKNGLLIGLSILAAGTVLSAIGYLFIKAYG
jgi:hypothetical protein